MHSLHFCCTKGYRDFCINNFWTGKEIEIKGKNGRLQNERAEMKAV